MTADQAHRHVVAYQQRETQTLKAIAECVRSMIPVMKDHQLTHAAAELERHLFVFDALYQEESEWIKVHAVELVEAVMKSLGGNG